MTPSAMCADSAIFDRWLESLKGYGYREMVYHSRPPPDILSSATLQLPTDTLPNSAPSSIMNEGLQQLRSCIISSDAAADKYNIGTYWPSIIQNYYDFRCAVQKRAPEAYLRRGCDSTISAAFSSNRCPGGPDVDSKFPIHIPSIPQPAGIESKGSHTAFIGIAYTYPIDLKGGVHVRDISAGLEDQLTCQPLSAFSPKESAFTPIVPFMEESKTESDIRAGHQQIVMDLVISATHLHYLGIKHRIYGALIKGKTFKLYYVDWTPDKSRFDVYVPDRSFDIDMTTMAGFLQFYRTLCNICEYISKTFPTSVSLDNTHGKQRWRHADASPEEGNQEDFEPQSRSRGGQNYSKRRRQTNPPTPPEGNSSTAGMVDVVDYTGHQSDQIWKLHEDRQIHIFSPRPQRIERAPDFVYTDVDMA